MAQILIAQRVHDEAVARARAAGFSVEMVDAESPLPPEALRARAAAAQALVCLLNDRVDAALLDAAPGLKVVANVAVGHDNVDLAAASARGLVVTNTPDVLTEATADHASALLLAAARRLPEADAFARAHQDWVFALQPPLSGLDVSGKTLGVDGLGRIGAAVARRGALGFGMNVRYTARGDKPEAAALGARRVDFDELLAESDFLSVHLPLTPETRHRYTLAQFERMKPGAVLVNVARGPIVREADLAEALDRGLIAGAGLDVFEHEPRLHPALARQKARVVLAPHLGSATRATRLAMATLAVDNALAALRGRCPPNALNPEAWGAR